MAHKYKYCPKCASDLKQVVLEENLSPRLVCSNGECGFIFYQNSSPAVVALITDGDRILLGKRGISPKKGTWALPGGFLDNGEEPEAGLKREMMEELGVEIKNPKISGIFVDTYIEEDNFVICLYYEANINGQEPKAGSDIDDIKWFSAKELPRVAFKGHGLMIDKWLKDSGLGNYNYNEIENNE
jgi:ADP-ribose pyrophosphatase YjhB (NUDIX family)